VSLRGNQQNLKRIFALLLPGITLWLIYVAFTPALSFADEADYVKRGILSSLHSFNGRVGDGLVILSIVGFAVSAWRKSFKSAAGCLFLIGGIVILRILISVLFSDL
jgi:hypothetical protein